MKTPSFPIAAVLLCVFLPTLLHAQTNETKRARKPSFTLLDTWESRADFKADGALSEPGENPSVAVNEIQTGFTAPLFFSERMRLMSGITLRWHRFFFSDVGLDDANTYDVSIPFNAIFPVNESWSFMAMLAPGVHTDFNKVDHNDFKTSSLLLANYTWSEQLKLSLGVAYSRIFGDDEFFPAAGLVWNPTPDWAVHLIFPRPGISYTFSERLRFQLGASPAGGKWNVEDLRSDRNNGEEYTFEFKGWRLGIGLEYALTERWSLVADLGTTLRRSITIENDDETLLDSDVDDTFGVRIGLLGYVGP